MLFADLDFSLLAIAKSAADPVGHYSRPDIVRLQFMKEAEAAEAARAALEGRTSEHLQKTAERHEISREQLESGLERLAQKAG